MAQTVSSLWLWNSFVLLRLKHNLVVKILIKLHKFCCESCDFYSDIKMTLNQICLFSAEDRKPQNPVNKHHSAHRLSSASWQLWGTKEDVMRLEKGFLEIRHKLVWPSEEQHPFFVSTCLSWKWAFKLHSIVSTCKIYWHRCKYIFSKNVLNKDVKQKTRALRGSIFPAVRTK